jgi:ribosome-binding protein aMBF1 (putative translation factor)
MSDKQKYGFEHQDLEVLHIVNKEMAKKNALKRGIARGSIETTSKTKTNNPEASAMWKLEQDTENLKIDKVNKSISEVIRNQRTKLGLKQKDLANKINVTPTIIQQYENGSIKSDIKILIKLEKALKCKLTGKGFTK